MLHLDVMDGHFVPNISFGVPVIEKLRLASKLFFDTHLMISDPMKYARPFAEAGSNLLTFHIEVAPEPMAVIEHLRSLGVNVGITLNPGTPASAIAAVIEAVDLVLVMSVWPGFGGQTFIESSLDKLRELRPRLRPDQRLEPVFPAAGPPERLASAEVFAAFRAEATALASERPWPISTTPLRPRSGAPPRSA